MMNKLRWTKYVLPNGREVYLTQRPDSAESKSVDNFEKEKKPLVRFCYCDDFVTPTKTPWHWLPWVPHEAVPLHNAFASIKSIDYYNKTADPKRPLWLHCDSSLQRAPTFFGLFLRAVYPNEEKSIVEAMTVCENSSFEFASYSRVDKYADISFQTDPHMKSFIESWKKGGESEAHNFYMNLNKKTY
jgi:hypothetical protein